MPAWGSLPTNAWELLHEMFHWSHPLESYGLMPEHQNWKGAMSTTIQSSLRHWTKRGDTWMWVGWQLPPGWIQYFLPVNQVHGPHWPRWNLRLDVVYDTMDWLCLLHCMNHTTRRHIWWLPSITCQITHKVLDTEWTEKENKSLKAGAPLTPKEGIWICGTHIWPYLPYG